MEWMLWRIGTGVVAELATIAASRRQRRYCRHCFLGTVLPRMRQNVRVSFSGSGAKIDSGVHPEVQSFLIAEGGRKFNCRLNFSPK